MTIVELLKLKEEEPRIPYLVMDYGDGYNLLSDKVIVIGDEKDGSLRCGLDGERYVFSAEKIDCLVLAKLSDDRIVLCYNTKDACCVRKVTFVGETFTYSTENREYYRRR